MAAKVNTKFIVILVSSLLVLALGVGGLAVYSLRMSGERNIAAGDQFTAEAEQALASGDAERANELFLDAASQYSRAVNKDVTRRDWLEVWRDTLLRTTPSTDVEYDKQYRQRYLGVLDRLAALNPSEPGPQLELVLEQERLFRTSGGANAMGTLATTIERRMASLPADSPTAIRLRGLRGLADNDRAGFENVDVEIRERAQQEMREFYDAFKEDRERFLEPVASDTDAEAAEAFAQQVRDDHARVALGLVRWHLNERRTALNEGRSRAAAEQLGLAKERITQIQGDGLGYDRDPLFLFQQIDIDNAIAADQVTNPTERQRVTGQIISDAANQIFRIIESSPEVDIPVAQLAALATWAVESDSATTDLTNAFESAVRASPNDPRTLRAAAEGMRRIGQLSRALELYEQLRALPKPPLSLEGLILPDLKLNAAYSQVAINLQLRQEAIAAGRSTEARSFLDAARSARTALQEEGGIATRRLRLRADADIAIAEGENLQAIRLLEEFRREFGENPDVLAQLATLHLRQGTPGEAKEILERLLANGSINNQGVLMLAEMYRADGELARALQTLEDHATRTAEPGQLVSAIEQVRRLIAIESGEESDDPVLAAVIRANEAIARRDFDQARSLLETAERSGPDAAEDLRIMVLRSQVDILTGDRDAARARIERALSIHQDNPTLTRMLQQISTDDPVAQRLAEIDASDRSEVDKALARFGLLSSVGRIDEAMAALDEVERLDPQNQTVVEVRFAMAIEENDLEAAARIAAKAAEANTDGVDGLMYQGRLQMARGNRNEAVRTLRTAVEMVPSSVQLRRYLGQALVQNGQIDEGLEFFKRAYEAQRDNLQVLNDYVQVLRRVGRVQEARDLLDPGNNPTAPARANRGFTNIWLTLEAETGNQNRALTERRTYFRADQLAEAFAQSPEARENGLRLMELLINESAVDEAERVFDQVRPHLTSGERTRAQAGLAMGRATLIEDQEEAREAESRAVAAFRSQAAELAQQQNSPQPLIEVANFAFSTGGFDLGMDILRDAVRHESEADRQVSRLIAGRLAQRASQFDRQAQSLENQAGLVEPSNPLGAEALREQAAQASSRATSAREESAEVYQDILSDIGSSDETIALSLAELRLQMGQLNRAQQLVQSVRSSQPDNLASMLLAAQIAEQSGESAQAGRLYDQAVEKHPTNFLPFYRRALFRSSDQSRRADVLFDLRRVAELRPSLIEAWLLRYQIFMQANDPDSAFAALREGINAAPSNEAPLSRQLVQELSRAGRIVDAASLASSRARANPEDSSWQYTAGMLARQRGSMTEAAEFFARLRNLPDIQSDPQQLAQAAGFYLDAVLRSDREIPPAEITRLADEIAKMEGEGSTAVTRNMLLARAYAKIPSERARVSPLVQQGYLAASRGTESASPTQLLRLWFQQLPLVVGGNQAAYEYVLAVNRALQQQRQEDPTINHPVYIRTLAIQAEQIAGGAASDLASRAEQLLDDAEGDPVAQYELNKMLSGLNIASGDAESAVRYGMAALEFNGQDLELLNNVAFFLAKQLDRVEEALPLAQRAAQIAPENADVLDTVGVVYMLSGDYSRAAETFQLALRFARTQEQRLPANVHMAETLLRNGDARNARQYLEAAERLLPVVAESSRSSYAAEVTDLRQRLDNTD